MDNSDITTLMGKVGQLSLKMRFLKTLQSAGSETSELKDREILLLELIGSRGPLTVAEIRKHFPNLGPSTISADLKKFRTVLGYVEKKFGMKDERTHLVELTAKGISKIDEIKQTRLQLYKPLSSCFQERPQSFEVLSDFLDLAISKVNQELSEYGWSD